MIWIKYMWWNLILIHYMLLLLVIQMMIINKDINMSSRIKNFMTNMFMSIFQILIRTYGMRKSYWDWLLRKKEKMQLLYAQNVILFGIMMGLLNL